MTYRSREQRRRAGGGACMDAGMRVTRGGGWRVPDQVCGAAARYANQPPTSPQVPPPTTQQPHLATTLVITPGASHSYLDI